MIRQILQIFNDIAQDLKLLQREIPGITAILALAVAIGIGLNIHVVHAANTDEIHLRAHLLAGTEPEPADRDACDSAPVPGVTVVVALSHNSVELSIPASNVTSLWRTTRSTVTTALQRVTG